MSIVVASYANLVISIAALRESGILKRRRATPASPSLLIAGQAFSTVAGGPRSWPRFCSLSESLCSG